MADDAEERHIHIVGSGGGLADGQRIVTAVDVLLVDRSAGAAVVEVDQRTAAVGDDQVALVIAARSAHEGQKRHIHDGLLLFRVGIGILPDLLLNPFRDDGSSQAILLQHVLHRDHESLLGEVVTDRHAVFDQLPGEVTLFDRAGIAVDLVGHIGGVVILHDQVALAVDFVHAGSALVLCNIVGGGAPFLLGQLVLKDDLAFHRVVVQLQAVIFSHQDHFSECHDGQEAQQKKNQELFHHQRASFTCGTRAQHRACNQMYAAASATCRTEPGQTGLPPWPLPSAPGSPEPLQRVAHESPSCR